MKYSGLTRWPLYRPALAEMRRWIVWVMDSMSSSLQYRCAQPPGLPPGEQVPALTWPSGGHWCLPRCPRGNSWAPGGEQKPGIS